MRSSRLGGPRAVTRPAAAPWAESRPLGHPNVMNALDCTGARVVNVRNYNTYCATIKELTIL